MMRISSLYGRCRALGRKCMLYGGGLRKKRFGSVFMKAERTGEKQKKKLSGVRKNIGRKKEVEPRERDRKDERSADIRKYIARDSRPNGKDGEVAATLFESAK